MSRPLPALAGTTHRQVQVGDLSVHVAEAGQGEPLVLLHGWPQHWWCWRHVVPLLASSYRLVMPDLRGHGWTSVPQGGYDKEQLATDLLGLLDELELPQVGLVGHDWGGWTGFLAALRAPERFRGFVALGITHPFQKPDLRVLEAWRGTYQVVLGTPVLGERLLRTSPALLARLIRAGVVQQDAFTDDDLRVFTEVLQEPARARASSALYRTFVLKEGLPVMAGKYRSQRLTVPTRLIGGAADPVATGRLLDGWQQHADDMTVTVLDDCGHFVPEEKPEVVATAVRQLFG